jgi:hypothetical protein
VGLTTRYTRHIIARTSKRCIADVASSSVISSDSKYAYTSYTEAFAFASACKLDSRLQGMWGVTQHLRRQTARERCARVHCSSGVAVCAVLRTEPKAPPAHTLVYAIPIGRQGIAQCNGRSVGRSSATHLDLDQHPLHRKRVLDLFGPPVCAHADTLQSAALSRTNGLTGRMHARARYSFGKSFKHTLIRMRKVDAGRPQPKPSARPHPTARGCTAFRAYLSPESTKPE